MRGPKPAAIELTAAERQEVEALLRRHSTPQQLVLRARIVLAAAAGRNNAQIARDLAVDLGTVRLWRGRWLGLRAASLADLPVEERLTDAPRSGAPGRITAEQVCRIVALACAAPARSGRPISPWTGREVAAAAVARGIVPARAPRHAERLRTRGRSSPTASATG